MIEEHTRAIATELEVLGLINVQYAVKANQVFVIEANPRASRTVPFVAKATGVPLVKVAARVMVGRHAGRAARGGSRCCPPSPGGYVAIKEAVLPFSRFPDADTVLGPEMRSTGEVMGIDTTFGLAFAKSQLAAGDRLPASGCVFMSLADRDKAVGIEAARRFVEAGFRIVATAGTADALDAAGIPVETRVAKVGEPTGTDAVELISSGKVRPRRQQPAWPRRPRRRRPHPRRGRRARGAVPHDRRGRAGGRQRHRRHAPPTSCASARCRSSTAASTSTDPRCRSTDDHARRATPSTSTTTVGSVVLPNPVLTASGTAGHGAELAPYVDLGCAGRGRREVALGASRGRATRRSGCTRPSAACSTASGSRGPGVAAWLADDLPPLAGHRRPGRRLDLGAHAWPSTRPPPSCSPTPRPRVVAVEVNLSCPNTEAARDLFAHSASATARRHGGDRRRAAARGGPSSARTSPTSCRSPTPPGPAGAEAVTLVNTVLGMAIDPETGRLPAGLGRSRRRAVGPGDPPGRRAGGPRRARRPARPADRRRRRRRQRRGRRRAAPRRGLRRAGRHGHLRRPPGARPGCCASCEAWAHRTAPVPHAVPTWARPTEGRRPHDHRHRAPPEVRRQARRRARPRRLRGRPAPGPRAPALVRGGQGGPRALQRVRSRRRRCAHGRWATRCSATSSSTTSPPPSSRAARVVGVARRHAT